MEKKLYSFAKFFVDFIIENTKGTKSEYTPDFPPIHTEIDGKEILIERVGWVGSKSRGVIHFMYLDATNLSKYSVLSDLISRDYEDTCYIIKGHSFDCVFYNSYNFHKENDRIYYFHSFMHKRANEDCFKQIPYLEELFKIWLSKGQMSVRERLMEAFSMSDILNIKDGKVIGIYSANRSVELLRSLLRYRIGLLNKHK